MKIMINLNLNHTYISYLDANNLYGLAMCKKLPYGDFEWYILR